MLEWLETAGHLSTLMKLHLQNTMAGGMVNPKEGADGQQYGADSSRNVGWTVSKTEEVSQPMCHCGAIHRGDYRHNMEAPLEQKE